MNGLYKSGRTAFAMGNIKWRASGGDNIKCLLITRDYTPDLQAHASLASIPEAARIGKTDKNREVFPKLIMSTPEDGICDAHDIDFGCVQTGKEIKGIVVFKDAPSEDNATLIAFVALDFITNGTQVIVGWDDGPNKIFKL